MEKLELTVAEIKELMSAFQKNKLGSFQLQQGNFCLKLEASRCEGLVPAPVASVAAQAGGEPEPPAGTIVTSPIVGTFYASPSPDSAPYVAPGTVVKKGDVLFIIESMKLMNEVTCEFDGTIGEIFVQNEAAVEYGQPVLTIV